MERNYPNELLSSLVFVEWWWSASAQNKISKVRPPTKNAASPATAPKILIHSQKCEWQQVHGSRSSIVSRKYEVDPTRKMVNVLSKLTLVQ